jgi:transcriptional regulator with XRE-family HTH domain
MEDVMLNVRALAAMKKMTITELANACGINPNHLKQVSAGNVVMTGDDLKKLSRFTGVPSDNIETEY